MRLFFIKIVTGMLVFSGSAAWAAYDFMEYFPLAQGSFWAYTKDHYDETGSVISQSQSFRIVGDFEQINGVQAVQMIYFSGDFQDMGAIPMDYDLFSSDDQFLYIHGAYEYWEVYYDYRLTRFDPPIKIKRFIDVGDTVSAWTMEISPDGWQEPVSLFFRLERVEDINTPAGFFADSLVFEITESYQNAFGDNVEYVWFARGVGEIKNQEFMEDGTISLSQLTDYQNMNQPETILGSLKTNLSKGVVPLTIDFYTLITQGELPFQYFYDFGDGTPISAGNSQISHTYVAPGIYKAKVTVMDDKGQLNEFTSDIVVIEDTELADYQAELFGKIGQVTQVTDVDALTSVLLGAENNIEKTLETLQNADEELKSLVEADVQNNTGALISNTRDKLEVLISDGKIQENDIQNISKNLSGVVSKMVAGSVPVREDTLSDLKSVSMSLFSVALPAIVAGENLSPSETDEIKNNPIRARQFFESKSHLLDDVVETTGVAIETSARFDLNEIDTIARGQNLTLQQTALLYDTVEPSLDVGNAIVSCGNATQSVSIAEIARDIITLNKFGKSVVSSVIYPVTNNIRVEFADGSFVSFSVKRISIIDEYLPRGIFDLPDGSRLGVTDSYAVHYVSYPVFPYGLNSELLKVGLIPKLEKTGKMTLDVDGGKLVLRSGWGNRRENVLQGITTSFSVTGGSDPAAEAYSLLVTYDSGISQTMPPSLMAFDPFEDMLEVMFPGAYAVNADTGIIRLDSTDGSLNLKPDYVFVSLPLIDYALIETSGGFRYHDLAFELLDANKDGWIDLKYYSDNPMGYQIIYSVPN